MGHVGSPVKRLEDPRLLTGRGRYVDDLALPRLAHAAILRSPHAHARIVGIDLGRVREAPGVIGVLTGDEAARRCRPCRGILLHYKGMKTGAFLPLAVERVRYAGEPVAVVAAETRAQAEDALALAAVDYAPLPPVLTPAAALAEGSPVIHPEIADNVIYQARAQSGDAERALTESARVYRRTFVSGRHTGVPLEPRGLVVDAERVSR